MEILKNPNYEFISKTKYFVTLSLVLIVSGLAFIYTRHLTYGVEFSGGTQIIAGFTTNPAVDKIRSAVDAVDKGAVIQTYGEPQAHKVLIRVAAREGQDTDLDREAKTVIATLGQTYPENPVVESSTEIVGAIVGGELRQKAVYLTLLGLLFQLIYIAVRFKGGAWGVAAALAGVHDLLICLAFLAFFHYEITLNVIAALLTLVGYSVNDTIVVFDRVRENLRQKRKDSLRKVLNDSVNQTLTRTLISNGTTFLSVLGLFLFGGEVLAGFSFTMVVGILVGTYSTIFIAIPIVLWWTNWRGAPDAPVGAKAAA